jgi:hypothetical protein
MWHVSTTVQQRPAHACTWEAAAVAGEGARAHTIQGCVARAWHYTLYLLLWLLLLLLLVLHE